LAKTATGPDASGGDKAFEFQFATPHYYARGAGAGAGLPLQMLVFQVALEVGVVEIACGVGVDRQALFGVGASMHANKSDTGTVKGDDVGGTGTTSAECHAVDGHASPSILSIDWDKESVRVQGSRSLDELKYVADPKDGEKALHAFNSPNRFYPPCKF
jgi:hypothetical protein